MLIPHKGHTDTIQVYSVNVMTHVKALQAGHSSQGTSEPITPALSLAMALLLDLYLVNILIICIIHEMDHTLYRSVSETHMNQSSWVILKSVETWDETTTWHVKCSLGNGSLFLKLFTLAPWQNTIHSNEECIDSNLEWVIQSILSIVCGVEPILCNILPS